MKQKILILILIILGLTNLYLGQKLHLANKESKQGWFQDGTGNWHQVKIEYKHLYVSPDKKMAAWKVSETLLKGWDNFSRRRVYLDGELISEEKLSN